MTGPGEGARDRLSQASDWFARMRGPDEEVLRGEFERWRSHPENRRAYDEIAAIWDIAGTARHRSPPMTSIPRRPKWLVPGLVAAGLGSAVVLGMLVRDQSPFGGAVRERSYAASAGSTREVALSDGSRVALGPASRMRAAIAPEERLVTLLEGRARFSVAHDSARPFVVVAGGHAVVARGTVFEVRIASGTVDVTLLQGAVDLEERSDHAPPRFVGRLRPGQTASFGLPGAAPRIASVSAGAGPGDILSGDGMRLGDVAAAANRAGGNRIILAGPELADLRISGGFRPAEADALAAMLAAALELELRRRPDGAIVLGPVRRGPQADAGP